MISKTIKIINEAGVHCRPSSRIMQKVLEYPGCIFKVESAKGETDLTSILGLIGLGLEFGDEVKISVEGPRKEQACEDIAILFATNFNFPQ